MAQSKHRDDQLFVAPVIMEKLRPSAFGDSSGGALKPATGAALTFDRVRYVRHARITLTGLVINVDESDDYGGTKILDLPDSNILILGVEADLSLDKGAAGGGIIASTDVVVGIGTAVASNSTLAAAMIDVLTETLTANEDPAIWKLHSHELGTPALVFADDAAAGALYLNAACSIGTSDTLTVTGTIDFYYIDVGNVTS